MHRFRGLNGLSVLRPKSFFTRLICVDPRINLRQPAEKEMEALSMGGVRVLEGLEEALEY